MSHFSRRFIMLLAVTAVWGCGKKDAATSESSAYDLFDYETRGETLESCNAKNNTRYYFRMQATTIDGQVPLTEAIASDTPLVYLPFPAGKTYSVSQGYGGSYSHDTAYSRYAVDFDMPECSAIAAVAAGRVMLVKESSNSGGARGVYSSRANTIDIDHGGGAVARYAHLCKNCVLVQVGDLVNAGQIIALSGNTGYSTAAHLHFQMDDMETGNSYEKKFADIPTNSGIPVAGDSLVSGNQERAGSGAAFSGHESTIPLSYFTANQITLTSSIPWYNGFKKGQSTVISGTTTSSHEYVVAFVYDSTGNVLYSATEPKSGSAFTIVFTPRADALSGNQYHFALTTKATSGSSYSSAVGIPVFIGD